MRQDTVYGAISHTDGETGQMKDAIVKLALSCGATNAAALPARLVALDAVFRDICQSNTCGKYGKCYMCPPDVGDIRAMMEEVRAFRDAVMYQTVHPLEDSFDYEGMTQAGARHAAVSQALQRELKKLDLPSFLHVSVGGCRVCEVCAKAENLPCPYPDLAMPSLESYGVDVYNTALHAGLKYLSGQNTVTYFGMVLLGEA